MITNTSDIGCPGYSYIKAAKVDDLVQVQGSPYTTAYQNFTFSDPLCKAPIKTRAILTSYDPAPSCIDAD